MAQKEQSDRVCRIPRIRIRRFENQPRRHFSRGALEELANSISEVGQLTPIKVKRIAGDPEHDYELIDGERRLRACEMVSVETMKAFIVTLDDPDEQFLDAAVSNFGRVGHTPIEIAQAMAKVMNSKRLEGLSHAEKVRRLSRIFACSEVWVYQNLSVLKLHPDIQKMMLPDVPEEKRMTFTLGIYIASLPQELQLKIATIAVKKKMSVNRARLLARKLASEAGVKLSERERTPTDEERVLMRLAKNSQDGLARILDDVALKRLLRRPPRDIENMLRAVKVCTRKFQILQMMLMGEIKKAEEAAAEASAEEAEAS